MKIADRLYDKLAASCQADIGINGPHISDNLNVIVSLRDENRNQTVISLEL